MSPTGQPNYCATARFADPHGPPCSLIPKQELSQPTGFCDTACVRMKNDMYMQIHVHRSGIIWNMESECCRQMDAKTIKQTVRKINLIMTLTETLFFCVSCGLSSSIYTFRKPRRMFQATMWVKAYDPILNTIPPNSGSVRAA